jgi:O-antigen ligase
VAVAASAAEGRNALAALTIAALAAGLALLVRPAWMLAGLAALAFAALLALVILRPQLWPAAFCATATLLPPLPLEIGGTGLHPAMAMACAGLLATMVWQRHWRVSFDALNLALAGILGAAALSLGFALLYSGPAVMAASAARFTLLAAGIYVYFFVAHGPGAQAGDVRSVRWIFAICGAGALMGSIDFVYQLPAPAGFGAQFIWLDSGVYRRAQGLFYDASALGNFSCFFLVMCAVAVADRRPRASAAVPLWAGLAGAALATAALFLSFSRAPVLAAVIACGALGFLERRRWWRPRAAVAWATFGFALATAAAVFAVALPEFALGYWDRWETSWDRVFAAPDQVLSGRLNTWSTVLEMIQTHPLQTALGIGYKTLPYTEHFGKPVIADNMYLSMLVETGVLGLLALIAANAAILNTGYRAAQRGSFFGKWIFCFWLGESVQMLAGDILTFWRVLPLYFWVLGVAVLDLRQTERPNI